MSLKAQIEAIIYVAEEPVTLAQLNVALCTPVAPLEPAAEAPPEADAPPPDLVLEPPAPAEPAPSSASAFDSAAGPTLDDVRAAVDELIAEYRADSRGIEIKEVAGGYKMATKPEHHEAVRRFVKSLKPPMKLSLAALETLAVVAYRQPVTIPEIGEVRGVNTGGVIKTLLDKRLVTTAGRKNVIGRPILYRTTKEFLVQFGLKDVSELPSLKEFEELARSLTEES
jgi:segregation and condensation protein B